MGLRSRLSKIVGPAPSPTIEASEQQQGMLPTRAFSPGEPIAPYDGYSTTPRSHDYVTGYNIAARPRRNERVSFDTLRGMVDAYDVAQMCIWHRIDSIRSLDWSLVAMDGVEGDVTDAIKLGMAALRKPDRKTPFKVWLGKWLYDILAFDAGTLYRLRNRGGRPIGLKVVDGTTIAPLLDAWGDPPDAPAPSFVQFAQGVPWVWLTDDDLIYAPFRATSSTPYGKAPLETILLNANTDLRFQVYFLQRFTEGNLPEAFASAPETWTATQIQEFQQYWDSFMLGDQAAKHQIKWIPGGGEIAWTNEKDFTDQFSLFLMRKTCAAYHVVPSDLGFTESVNRSSGESQADVSNRIGDRPLAQHCQEVLSAFIQDDLGLPLTFQFDLGDEEEDRLATAQADQIYMDRGVIGSSEVRELRYGKPEPDGEPVPRFIFTNARGPIPLAALKAVAGQIDPETGAPEPGAASPPTPFVEVPGVIPMPTLPIPQLTAGGGEVQPAGPIAKDTTAGITTDTGVVSYDLIGRDGQPVPEQDGDPADVAKANELAQYRRFVKARARAGKWRDFTFTSTDQVTAHRLNDAGRAQIRKDAGQTVAAGLAVQAVDTGRVLMLQRALSDDDPAGGTWEFPGGHIEDGETPMAAAKREWQEETGCLLPDGDITGQWASANGIYEGFVLTIATEQMLDIRDRGQVNNPDDPDGDVIEAIAWWDPAQLAGMPALRPELAGDLDAVLNSVSRSIEQTITAAEAAGLVKAGGGGDPKGSWRDGAPLVPQHQFDLALTDHYAPRVTDALQTAFPDSKLRTAIDAAAQRLVKAAPDPGEEAVLHALSGLSTDELEQLLRELWADAYVAGAHAAGEQIPGGSVVFGDELGDVLAGIDWDTWEPGDDLAADAAADSALAELLGEAGAEADGILGTTVDRIGSLIADGLASGASIDDVARTLSDYVDDSARAVMIAHTETARAMTAATMRVYGLNGIEQWDLITTSGACQRCLDIEADNPHRVGGGQTPPEHPLCRCAAAPRASALGEPVE